MHRKGSASSTPPPSLSNKRKRDEIISDDIEEPSDIDVEGGAESADEVEVEKTPKKKRARKGEALTTMELLAQLQPLPPLEERDFSSKDTDLLSVNESFRYIWPSRRVGHAVIVKGEDGKDRALQYHIPQGDKEETPEYRQLKNIEQIDRFGMTRYKALTLSGSQMYATRYEDGEFNGEKFKIANFSPEPKIGKEPFWGSKKDLDIFDEKKLADPEIKADLAEIAKKGIQYKGGRDFPIDPLSVQKRDHDSIRKAGRKPDQKDVMGESARDAYEGFFDTWTEELTPKMREIFKRAFDAPLKDPKDAPLKEKFRSHYRPEWLHAEGHGLTPADQDPQRKDNLGAAGKWVNTEMMVLERIVKWFALNRPNALESIKPHFEMLLDSELIKHVNFEVSIEEQGNIVKLLQSINPFKEWPVFRKATDLTQATAITYSMLNGIDPISIEPIKGGETLRARPDNSQQKKPAARRKLAAAKVADESLEKVADESVEDEKGVEAPAAPVAKQKKAAPVAPTKVKQDNVAPIVVNYDRSVMQVVVAGSEYDYDDPWSPAKPTGGSGSAWVIEHDGIKYIVTNGHVVENALFLTARFANDRDKMYEAKVKKVIYQCDLAVLEIQDPEFQRTAVPVVLGDMVKHKQPVEVVGFPLAGDEVNFSEGTVSRIEVSEYSMSGLDMLAVGITAAINPGNSGGPVFSNGRAVGVAFQGYIHFQGLGFMIPMPIVKHFLNGVFSGKEYRGFPVIPYEIQHLENPTLAYGVGLQEGQSGVRIKSIHPISKASQQLKKGDVLLEIDGMTISNTGTVKYPGVGDVVNMLHVMHMKNIGDQVVFKLLRRNETTQQNEVLNVQVDLDSIPYDTTKVGVMEHDKPPTYFIYSGFSFEPVTLNYIEDAARADLEGINPVTGAGMGSIPKTAPGQQLVVINEVWSSSKTRGYDGMGYVSTIVKEVNGKEINNIRELIQALQEPRAKPHELITGSGLLIILPQLSATENKTLLAQHGLTIDQDRSIDLNDTRVGAVAAPVVDAMEIDTPAPTIKIPAPVVKAALAPVAKTAAPAPVIKPTPKRGTGSSFAALFSKMNEMAAEIKSLKKKEAVNEKDESEELLPEYGELNASPTPAPTPIVRKRDEELGANFTGVKRFKDAVAGISAQAQLMQDLGFEDEEFSLEDLGEGEEEESADDISDEATVDLKTKQIAARGHATLHKTSNKRKRDGEDDEKGLEDKHQDKRQRHK